LVSSSFLAIQFSLLKKRKVILKYILHDKLVSNSLYLILVGLMIEKWYLYNQFCTTFVTFIFLLFLLDKNNGERKN